MPFTSMVEFLIPLHPKQNIVSSRSIPHMQTVQFVVPKQVFFSVTCTGNLDEKPVYASQIKKLRKRFSGGTSSLMGQFLHSSPVQSSRSVQRMQTVQLCLNNFFLSRLAIQMRNQFMLHRSRNSGRDFLVEPAPLWASSYTHLLYKAQDPFSTCR